jgi:hypothetical protein
LGVLDYCPVRIRFFYILWHMRTRPEPTPVARVSVYFKLWSKKSAIIFAFSTREGVPEGPQGTEPVISTKVAGTPAAFSLL